MRIAAIVPDLRHAVTSLSRAPGFTVVAILTLGLGIGANTAAFSILNGVLLRPVPYPDSYRLERIFRVTPETSRGGIAPADYMDLKAGAVRYGAVAAYAPADMSVAEPGQPAELVAGLRISSDLLATLGTAPRLGRPFQAEEERPGNDRVILLGHRYWQRHFEGDSGVVGRTVRVDGDVHEIVGVLPAELDDWRHLGPFDLFRPLALGIEEARDRATPSLRVIGRRAEGLPRTSAAALIAGFGRRQAEEYPAANAGTTWRTVPIHLALVAPSAKGVIGMLIGLSGFVLLIACSNLANLELARAVARARELALRAALGASPLGLLRPLLLESLLLSLAGGIFAVYVAVGTNAWLNDFAAQGGDEPNVFALDARVLAWAFVACLFTTVAFGAVPALFALRLDINGVLKNGARGATWSRGHRRFRQVLVAGQFALAMVLLAGAAIFERGLQDWNDRGFGFDAARLVSGSVLLPPAAYQGAGEVSAFQRLAAERLEAIPGVASASFARTMPYFGLGETRRYVVAGQEPPPPGKEPAAAVNAVGPRYFETVGTPLLEGRGFDGRDTRDAPKVYVVNRAMARGLFGGTALGKRIALAGEPVVSWGEIVGIAGDVESVAADRVAATYQVYAPLAQEPATSLELAVRSSGVEPAALVDPIRTAMMELAPDLPVRQLLPAGASIAIGVRYQTVIRSILTFLAALGLGLACLGVYGVITRSTAERTGEFGIRLALGASRRDITRLVLSAGVRLALVGLGIGLLGALGLSRLVRVAFPGLQDAGLPVLAAVTVVLVAIALIAGYLPARSASRIDPAVALRAE